MKTKFLSVLALSMLVGLSACTESGTSAYNESVEVPQGTTLYVNPIENLSGKQVGDRWEGTLQQPLTVQGNVVAPVGTRVEGEIVRSEGGLGLGGGSGMTPESGTSQPGMNERSGESPNVTPGAPHDAPHGGITGDSQADRIEPRSGMQGSPGMESGQAGLGVTVTRLYMNNETHDVETGIVPLPEGMPQAGQTQQVLTFRLEESVELPVNAMGQGQEQTR